MPWIATDSSKVKGNKRRDRRGKGRDPTAETSGRKASTREPGPTSETSAPQSGMSLDGLAMLRLANSMEAIGASLASLARHSRRQTRLLEEIRDQGVESSDEDAAMEVDDEEVIEMAKEHQGKARLVSRFRCRKCRIPLTCGLETEDDPRDAGGVAAGTSQAEEGGNASGSAEEEEASGSGGEEEGEGSGGGVAE